MMRNKISIELKSKLSSIENLLCNYEQIISDMMMILISCKRKRERKKKQERLKIYDRRLS